MSQPLLPAVLVAMAVLAAPHGPGAPREEGTPLPLPLPGSGANVPFAVDEDGDTMTGPLVLARGADLLCDACIDPGNVSFAYAGAAEKGGKALDADLLDGLDSAQFLRSDTSGVLAGDLDVTGTLRAGALALDVRTRASLPLAGIAGRLAHVRDLSPSLWLDQGARWFDVGRGVLDVTAFGATGDDDTDDTAALQLALNTTAGRGGTVYFPPGRYHANGLTLPPGAHGTILRGSGWSDADFSRASWLLFDEGGLTIRGLSGVIVEELNLWASDRAGPVVRLDAVSNVILDRVVLVNYNVDQPAIAATNGLVHSRITNFVITQGRGYRQPAIDAVVHAGVDGAVNTNLVADGWFNGNLEGTAPLLRFEQQSDSPQGVAGTQNVLRNLVFETPAAGAIHLYSIARSLLDNVWAGDMGGAAPTGPLVKLAKSPANQGTSREITILGLEADFGTPANPTVLVEDRPAQGEVTIIGSYVPVLASCVPPPTPPTCTGGNPVLLVTTLVSQAIGTPPVRLGGGGRLDNLQGLATLGSVGVGRAPAGSAMLDVEGATRLRGDLEVDGNLRGASFGFGGAYEYYCPGNTGAISPSPGNPGGCGGAVRKGNPFAAGASCPPGFVAHEYWFYDGSSSNYLGLCVR